MAHRAGVDLERAHAGGADPLGIHARLLVAFDHRQRPLPAQVQDGLDEERRLARPRRRNEVEGKDVAALERLAVRGGEPAVCFQQVALKPDQAAGAALHFRQPNRALGIVERLTRCRLMGRNVVVRMAVRMVVVVLMVMRMRVAMVVVVVMVVRMRVAVGIGRCGRRFRGPTRLC
ncbi:conserved hypothetical protein [uncultured Defluviicoccus sp.]|uniref:Uncharacterized protein n=1 Tax=metagenome TaxID=256318 RepID=A0A380TEV6_9ZZZZ|nr:conserved hypothetical protein [uncultured Defluviicoccus sp.]